jgi:hypothetical protein
VSQFSRIITVNIDGTANFQKLNCRWVEWSAIAAVERERLAG